MQEVQNVELFINNKFVPASTKETFELSSPYTGEVVAKVAEASVDDVNTAVLAAQASFPAWSAMSPLERGRPLKKLGEKILAETQTLAGLEALSMGRPVGGYFDATYASVHFNYFGEAGYAQGHTSLNTPGFLNMSLKQPFGVVGVIIPWNAPLVFFSKKIAPAVAAGNCVVLKSSEKAPMTSWKVAQWIEECGFPPGVINVICGHGQTSGNAMSMHMKIRVISFTGSTATGRAIQIASAKSNLKKVVFELGGKGPAIVFDDADIDAAVAATEFSINYNSGQTCMANSRIYVQESIKKKFTEAFKRASSCRSLGDPSDPKVNHGPQADGAQYNTVLKYIELGKKSGSLVLDGTNEEAKHIVHPVVFTDQPEDAQIMKEEVFGPVVVINTFTEEQDVIDKANDTEYGLYAALFTKDLERAMRVSKKLESGMVGVNCASPTGSWDLPFGGYKGSGTGRESLLESMDHFLENKSIYFKVSGIGG
ncbi:aldehyde dehydrogenase domain-containing protein [Calycina marina]|uniref:aldehyde dehydrogenase (NAD(+)) n=1 Tax=Calycina marina TaxID=1763456 RepID=A0A9P7ZAX8_9HELO|nr:aldehyde dehydrogenase domain-containing protein [Calycina marina]